jgi:hypothetical protein
MYEKARLSPIGLQATARLALSEGETLDVPVWVVISGGFSHGLWRLNRIISLRSWR